MFTNKVVSIANGVIMLQIPKGVGERGFGPGVRRMVAEMLDSLHSFI
jgi:hypothetical protein